MPTFTVPGDVVEDLVKIFRGVVPQDVGSPDRSDNSDDVYALAEMMAIGECVSKNWQRMARVTYADGVYLELQAAQVGLFKQAGEGDPSLRQRIRTPPFAVTPDLILTALQSIVDAAGGGTVYLVELPRDGFRWSRKQCWSRGWRWASINHGIVIALIPASRAAVQGAVADALRAKVLAGKTSMVQLYQ
jgi:hypothetical protein